MTKIFDASCEAGVVSVEGVQVEATILSIGQGPSTGILLLDGLKSKYVTSNALDIQAAIEKLGDILSQVSTILTGLDGVTNSPGGQISAISELDDLASELAELGDNLR